MESDDREGIVEEYLERLFPADWSWADSLAQARPLIGVNHYWGRAARDLNLPDGDGLTLLPQLRTAPDRPTVIRRHRTRPGQRPHSGRTLGPMTTWSNP